VNGATQRSANRPIAAERLDALLRASTRLRQSAGLAAAVLRGFALLLGALLVAVAIDAVLAPPPAGLAMLGVGLLAVVVAAAASLPVVAWRRRFHPHRAARRIEESLGIADSRLIAAVDLMASDAPVASEALRRHAVQLGDDLAGTIPVSAAVDRGELWRAIRLAMAAVLVLAIAWAAVPRAFDAVIPRIVQPWADHPPLTWLDFEIDIEPQRVIEGRPAMIRTAIAGPGVPDRATLVWVDGDERIRVPLLRATASGDDRATRRFMLRVDRAAHTRTFYIDTDAGRSRRHTLRVDPVPLIESAHVRYEFPSYTGWAPSTGPLPASGIRALEGTEVTLRLGSNVPLDGGSLRLWVDAEHSPEAAPSTHALTPDPADPRLGTFTFTLDHSGEFAASLVHGDLSTPEPLTGSLRAVPDDKPAVRFLEPVPAVLAPEGWTVDVIVEASDDIGVSRMVLHRGVNGWGPVPVELSHEGTARRRTATYRFDLAALGAQAGDVITYFATAYDTHPTPQFAQTPVQAIQVISRQEYEEWARTQYRVEDLHAEWADLQDRMHALQAMREQALAELEALQQKLDSGEPLNDEDRARMAGLQQDLEDYRNEAIDLAMDMHKRAEQPALYDFEQAYQDALSRMAQELQAQASEADAMQRAMRGLESESPSQAAMDRFDRQRQRFAERDRPFDPGMQQEMQQLTEDIDRVRMADQLMGAAEQLRQAILQQRDIADRLQQFADRDTLSPQERAIAGALAEEQRQVREQVEEAVERFRSGAEEAREALPTMSGSAQQLVDAVERLDVRRDQQMAEQQAGSGAGRGASRSAMAAADKLESLLQEAGDMPGDAAGDLDGCLTLTRESWQNAMQQMAQARGLPGMMAQGGQGGGMAGSMARMAVMGPAARSGDGEGRTGRDPSRDGRGHHTTGDDADADDPLDLTPEATADRVRRLSALAGEGVPAQFRDVADAYFRRLAEDEGYNATNPGDQP
jgi:hypothetical protein